jgi:serine protease AprX
MRKFLALTIGALLLASGAVLLPARASLTTTPTVDGVLKTAVAQAKAADRVTVLVHSPKASTSRLAALRNGMTVLTTFKAVGVAVAIGTPAQVKALAKTRGLTHLEGNQALAFHLDTAHAATRMTDARSDFQTPAGSAYDGSGTSIAILDSGIDGTHPMFTKDGTSKVVRNLKLACALLVACEGDTAAGDANDDVFLDVTTKGNDSDTGSMGGHGTHVAGIAAGYAVETAYGRKLSGAAPGAKLVGLSIGQAVDVFGAAAGLNWILEHHDKPCVDAAGAAYGDPVTCPPIKAVNMSFGPTGGAEFDASTTTVKLQRKLVAAGVVPVHSAGNGDAANDGGNGSDLRTKPDGQDPTPGVLMVANYDDADNGTREGAVDFSSSRGQYGRPNTYPDISAPGLDITSACRPYLTICQALGGHVAVADPNYGTISGTSMASPYTAGVVANLVQANPSITPAQVENALKDTAHKFVAGGPYEADPANAGATTSFDKGAGLVDVDAAMAVALGQSPAAAPVQCNTSSPVIKDPAGDSGGVTYSADYFQPEPQLDVTEGRIDTDATALAFTVKVVDLQAADPTVSQGTFVNFDFVFRGHAYFARANRAGATKTFSLRDADGTVASGLAGSYNPDTDTITVIVPRAAFNPPAADGERVQAVDILHYRNTGAVGLTVDLAKSYCAVRTIGGGTSGIPATTPPAPTPPPEQPAPEATIGAGSPTYAWQGEASSSDPFVTADGCLDNRDPGCDNHFIQVDVPAGGGSLTVTMDSEDPGDLDVNLYDPEGNEISDFAGATFGSHETFTVPVTKAGVYTVQISPFVANGSLYNASLTLS